MEGVNYQPLLDGWGYSGPFYDHRFLGYDRAPYRSQYLPAQPMGPYLESGLPGEGGDLPDMGLMSDDSSSLDDDGNGVDDGLDVYSHVGLQKIVGKQMAVWCHRAPDTLAIFTPIPGDTLSTAVSFARSSLQCDTAVDRILLLVPGQKRPVDPALLQSVKHGTSLMVVPKHDYVVTLEVTQLKVKLHMAVSLTMTVQQVKASLQKYRGFPVDRTDLLFQDQPMENQRHLFDYHVKHGSTLFVMLHLLYDVHVKVETFWGQKYELYVDPCMTSASLLDTVLRRTISPQAGAVSTFFHLVLPRHALVLYSPQGMPMKWSSCLGLYGLHRGATFSLSTVALAHQMSLQTIPVEISKDKVHHFRVSKYDYWSVLALKLHGFLGYPVNLMRMFVGKREVDLARAIGAQSHKTVVHLDMSLHKADMDVYGGVFLMFKLGTDVEEELLVSPARTVKTVKTLLEEIGVPNATAYDLIADGIPLPDSGRIGNVVEEHKKHIDLKLRHYPVFVHAPKNVIYKMNAHAQEPLKVFKRRVEMKTGLSQKDYYMLMAGAPLPDSDSTPVFQSSLAINSSVFLMALQQHHIFFVVWDDWLVKLRLPFHPQPSEIKDILLKDRNIPEGSLSSVGNFLQWYFAMRATKKDLLHDYIQHSEQLLQDGHQRQSRPRKRTEEALWRQNCRQMQELQQALEKRYQSPQRHMVPPVQVLRSSTQKVDKPGVYYATYRNGHWQRINPEDLADTYLRTWSLPPDPVHKMHSSRRLRLRKSLSAMPDVRTKKGDGRHGRKEPEWMYSLKQMAQEDKIQPAHASLARHKRRKKKNRGKAR